MKKGLIAAFTGTGEMKKLMIVFLVILLLLAAVVLACAEKGETRTDSAMLSLTVGDVVGGGKAGEDCYWILDRDGTLWLAGKGSTEDYQWVEAENAMEERPWDRYLDQIRSVVIENGITRIGTGLFEGCSALRSMKFPATLEEFESAGMQNNQAFAGFSVDPENTCYSSPDGVLFSKDMEHLLLYPVGKEGDEYEIPYGVKAVHSFENSRLKVIHFPDTVTQLYAFALRNCRNLTEVVLPSGLSEISHYAFSDDIHLMRVTIPATVQKIGLCAFKNTPALQYVIFTGTQEQWTQIETEKTGNERLKVTAIHLADGSILNEEYQQSGLKGNGRDILNRMDQAAAGPSREIDFLDTVSFNVPEDWEETPAQDYYIPSMGEAKAFVGKDGLHEACVLCAEMKGDWETPEMFIGQLEGGDSSFEIRVIQGKKWLLAVSNEISSTVAVAAFYWNGPGSVIMVSAGTNTPEAQYSEKLMTDIAVIMASLQQHKDTIPFALPKAETDSTVSEIGLTDARNTIPDLQGIPVAGSLAQLRLSEITTGGHIGEEAYWLLTNDGILYLFGKGPVDGFASEQSWAYDENEIPVPWQSYRNQVKEVRIEEGITVIGDYTINSCWNLEKIIIASTVEHISEGAIWNNVNLEAIEVSPDNQSYCSVDGILFSRDMKRLLIYPCDREADSYIIPDTVEEILSFQNSKLKSVTIPDSVTRIWRGAFYECRYLEELVLPAKLGKIEAEMLVDCGCLKRITIPESVKEIEENVFWWGLYSLRDIEYTGTEKQWDAILTASGNNQLSDPTIHFSDGVRNGELDNMVLAEWKTQDLFDRIGSAGGIESTSYVIDLTLKAEIPNDWTEYEYNENVSLVKEGTKAFRTKDDRGNTAEALLLLMEEHYQNQEEMFQFLDNVRNKPEKIEINGTEMILYCEDYDCVARKTVHLLYWSNPTTVLGVMLNFDVTASPPSEKLLNDLATILRSVEIMDGVH